MKRASNFDRLARAYAFLEAITFGPFLHQARCAFLADLRSSRQALVLGDGDGRFTARLLSENSTVLVDAVDLSAAMLDRLQHNAGPHRDRILLHQADARLWQPDKCYDLIATHFFLDCLTTREVAELAQKLRRGALPGCRWILSDFAIPPGLFGRLVARPLISALYSAFRLLTDLRVTRLPDYQSALAHSGFVRTAQHRGLRGLLIAEIWTFRAESTRDSDL